MSIEFFREGRKRYTNSQDILKDLNMRVILNYMAGGRTDDISYLHEVLFCPVPEWDELEKRHTLIQTCCENGAAVRELYAIVTDAYQNYDRMLRMIETDKGKNAGQDALIPVYVEALQWLAKGVSSLDWFLEQYADVFGKVLTGFREQFYGEMPKERIEKLVYFADNLDAFKREGDITFEMKFGEGLKLTEWGIVDVSKKADGRSFGFFRRRNKEEEVFSDPDFYQDAMQLSNRIIVRQMEKNWEELQNWRNIWRCLRKQTAFLLGCVTLYERGMERKFYFTYPDLEKSKKGVCEMGGIYELSLAFQSSSFPVANDVTLTGRQILVVTGENQGGKSTFLRSMGIAQVMYQCGMFVPAKSYSSKMYPQIFTHFTRREDAAMNTGRFEEELKRMEEILNGIDGQTLILLNESFSSTTEISAAKIALGLAHGISGKRIDLWTVTHITKFAQKLYGERKKEHLFLSAGRECNQEEKFKMLEKKPDGTSFGMELFDMVIGKETEEYAG